MAASAPTDHLALLYRISQTFNSSLDLDQVLNLVMDEVIAVMRAERGIAVLRDEEGRLSFRAARGIEQQTLDAPEFQVSRGLLDRVLRDGEAICTSDALSDARFNQRESVIGLRLRSILCVPLTIKDTITGALYVDNRLHIGLFTPADLALLTAIAGSAAIAIENARLYQLAVEKGRLERELQLARQLQRSLLPRRAPDRQGWEFASAWHPARQVAGDYYDFILSDDQAQLGLVVADVSDKGMASALFMALTRTTVRASVASAHAPAEGISRANALICADATDGMFVTLFYASLNTHSGLLTYVNAGHNPPWLYQAAADEFVRLTRNGMALGVDADAAYTQREVQLQAGDFVLLYTDGVTDALRGEEDFGEARLAEVLRQHRHAAAGALVAVIEYTLRAFTDTALPFDDITMVAIRRS
jgi:serine phosphatase RsbU (regulator of sigma subunit)